MRELDVLIMVSTQYRRTYRVPDDWRATESALQELVDNDPQYPDGDTGYDEMIVSVCDDRKLGGTK